jgi:hypothetical protein
MASVFPNLLGSTVKELCQLLHELNEARYCTCGDGHGCDGVCRKGQAFKKLENALPYIPDPRKPYLPPPALPLESTLLSHYSCDNRLYIGDVLTKSVVLEPLV